MLCYLQVYSKVIQLIYVYIYIFSLHMYSVYRYIQKYVLFQILFPYRLLQGIEYSSLCYTYLLYA